MEKITNIKSKQKSTNLIASNYLEDGGWKKRKTRKKFILVSVYYYSDFFFLAV